jgi:hypothetical protein
MTAYGRPLRRRNTDLTPSEWWRYLAARRATPRLITPRLIIGEMDIDPRITPEMLERLSASRDGPSAPLSAPPAEATPVAASSPSPASEEPL